MKHTPGPWAISDDKDTRISVVAPWSDQVQPSSASGYGDYRGIYVAVIEHQNDNVCVSKDQAMANARVIAEAPTLYASLKEMLSFWEAQETDTYCEACCAHAPKDDAGNPTGPIPHREKCPVQAGRAALARIEAQA